VVKQDTTSLLKVQNLFKSYQNSLVVNSFNLDLASGSVLGLLGPNGAGKSTILKMIAGLVQADKGEIITCERNQIGYCPQNPVFWKGITCEEQLKFTADLYQISKKKSKATIDFLMDQLFLKDKKDTIADHLSGGMQKRLNLALALIHNPKLLLLDEPTANLDIQSKEYVNHLLNHLIKNENITVVYASHDLDEVARIASNIIILNKGNIIYSKEFSTLDNDELKYSQLKNLYSSNTK